MLGFNFDNFIDPLSSINPQVLAVLQLRKKQENEWSRSERTVQEQFYRSTIPLGPDSLI